MQAEILTIGTELLLGKREDINSAYIAQELITIGLDLYGKTTVGNNERRITAILQQALARSDVVITSGGLGPAVDDVTRQAVATVAGRDLALDGKLLAQIELCLARNNYTVSEGNRRQAYIPQGAIPIENPLGVAPAFIVKTEQGLIISLPGVPRELEYLMETQVMPFLREKLQMDQVIIERETPLAFPDMTWVEAEETSGAPGEGVTTLLGLKLTIPDSGHDVEVPLTKEEISIGRLDPASGSFPDVDLSDYGGEEKGVSRRHAKIIRREGGLFIEDLGSFNGTFLNHKKLTPYRLEALKSGDELRLGKLVLRVSFTE
jgi:molybdenum cofactor synthesis domain-containing protein